MIGSHRNPVVAHRRPDRAFLAAAALACVVSLASCGGAPAADGAGGSAPAADTVSLVPTTEVTPATDGVAVPATDRPGRATATFAGGCFWCMEPPYDRVDGVLSTTSGFTGGEVEDPSYEDVAYGRTRHLEAVQVEYDPSRVSYTELLRIFWHNVDPTDDGGQFCDRGHQYTTAIFVHNDEQEALARASKERLREWGGLPGPVVTEVRRADPFYAAEDYHQDFYLTHSEHYRRYRRGCGRDQRLRELWGEAAPH